MRILVLGGTTEASALVSALAKRPAVAVTLSLAGRTSDPRPSPAPTRVGGFGGVEGLAEHLRATRTDLLIDATHPFAAVISRNAAAAARAAGVPLLALRRPPWRREAGDRWTEVDGIIAAARALGATPRNVFLTIGRLELAPFLAAAPGHRYLMRTIEPVGALPGVTAITERGPFDEAAERALMVREGVEVLVTKNSGGRATYGKVAAARALGLPVILVRQPEKPAVTRVETSAEALAWIEAHRAALTERGV